jgi:hypothetical protein
MTLRSEIRQALEIPSPKASQHRVHDLIARELDSLSRDTSVKTTGYFNHSWAPDLVLSPSEGEAERQVFLRFDVKHPSFADDLRYLAEKRPFFLDLLAANPSEGRVEDDEPDLILRDVLAEYAADDILVSEVPAVEAFGSGVKVDRGAKEATRSVVVGGKGFVDESAAEQIVGSWKEASSAVQAKAVNSLRNALDQIEVYLTEESALDFENTLRSKWMAAGGAAEVFPGQETWNPQARAPREIARLVVAWVDDGGVSSQRWEEIASAVSASDLGHELRRLGQHRVGGSVNNLVRSALKYWTATYAYAPPLESDTFERFDWSFGGYSFAINLVRCQAYFTDIGAKWSRVKRPEALPYVKEAMDVLGDANVLGVGLLTSEEDMSVTLRPSATMSLRDRVEQYIGEQPDAAWRSARITKVDVQVPGTTATAEVDFNRAVVHTSDAIPLRTFVELVARFVARLTRSEMAELKRSLDGEKE